MLALKGLALILLYLVAASVRADTYTNIIGFVDAYTGEVTPVRDYRIWSLRREHAPNQMYNVWVVSVLTNKGREITATLSIAGKSFSFQLNSWRTAGALAFVLACTALLCLRFLRRKGHQKKVS
jgi:hypothetical protein